MTKPTDIAELRRLLAAATEGPWCWDNRGEKCNDIQIGVAFASSSSEEPLAGYFDDEDPIYVDHVAEVCSDAPDAALIVALRNAAPAILDELERLRERCEQLESDACDLSALAARIAGDTQDRRQAMARAVRFAADSAFPNGRLEAEGGDQTTNALHWIALQRWADRIERGEVDVPDAE